MYKTLNFQNKERVWITKLIFVYVKDIEGLKNIESIIYIIFLMLLMHSLFQDVTGCAHSAIFSMNKCFPRRSTFLQFAKKKGKEACLFITWNLKKHSSRIDSIIVNSFTSIATRFIQVDSSKWICKYTCFLSSTSFYLSIVSCNRILNTYFPALLFQPSNFLMAVELFNQKLF